MNSYFNENSYEELSLKYVYQSDNRPWMIGYCGGKDSTTVVELVYKKLCMITSEYNNTYCKNIIWKGLPTPRMNGTFRWCSDRLKIKPSADKKGVKL